jgi:hypothetical protein
MRSALATLVLAVTLGVSAGATLYVESFDAVFCSENRIASLAQQPVHELELLWSIIDDQDRIILMPIVRKLYLV